MPARKTTKASALTTVPDFSAAVPAASSNALANVSLLVERMRPLTTSISTTTAALEQLTNELTRLQLTDIPEAMQEVGLEELKLTDGAKLVVKENLNVNINRANTEAAHAWLRQQGLDSIIKSQAVIDLRTLTDDERTALLATAEHANAEVVVSESIHASTLKATVKDMLERGIQPPASFGIHQFRKAELKEPKR